MARFRSNSLPFTPAPITCPGCHVMVPLPVDQCPHCGYNAWTCVDHFPYSPPPLDRYIDVENRLSNEDRARIDRAIDGLEEDLPQVRVYVCIVKLLPGTDARECGFWMLNASVPRDEEEAGHRPWSVLLLVDLHAMAAGITVGYGLDPFVSDLQLRAALNAGLSEFSEAKHGAAVLKVVHQMHTALKAAHREATAAIGKKGSGPAQPHPRFAPVSPAPRAKHPES